MPSHRGNQQSLLILAVTPVGMLSMEGVLYLIWYAVCICEAAEKRCKTKQAAMGTAEA